MNIQKFIETHNVTEVDQFKERMPGAIDVRWEKNDKNLVLLCTSVIPITDPSLELCLECNGTILEREYTQDEHGFPVFKGFKLVCFGLNRSIEYRDYFKIHEKESMDIKDFTVEPLVDGTLVRLWYNATKEKWQVSTSRKMDARYSYWSGEQNFADLFWSIANGIDLEKLNTRCTYSFVIRDPSILQVIPCKESSVLHVGTRDLDPESETYLQELDLSQEKNQVFVNTAASVEKMSTPKTIEFESFDKVETFVEAMSESIRGVLMKHKTKPLRLKLDSEQFMDMAKVRGNKPNLGYRYLDLLNDPEALRKLVVYYPEWKPVFDDIENQLGNLAKVIQNEYFNINVAPKIGKPVPVHFMMNPKHKQTIQQLHGQYKTSAKNNSFQKITVDVVRSKLYSLKPHILSWLLDWE